MPTRRNLLQGLSAASALTIAGRVWSAPAADVRLLIVFMRGAYDAANVVIPYASDFYYQSRPTLAVARPDGANANASLRLDADWALHPSLRDTLYPLWAKRELAFVPFTGASDDLTRSHFETQDTIELGQSVGGSRDYRSGFLSRLVGVLNGPRPIAFTNQLPLAFRGAAQVPNSAIGAVTKPGVDDRQAALIRDMYENTSLNSAVTEGFRVRDDVYNSISQELAEANRGAVSARGFELSARRMGRLMRDQYNLGFVDVGGWDTHVNQGNATGYLADRLGELGRAVTGFVEEIGPAAWRNTVVVAVSEFGRTFRENGDHGTDHGHGSAYWIMGGGINGGRVAGPQTRIEQSTLFQNRDFPVLTDYRALLGGLLSRLYGLDEARIRAVFPGSTPKNLELV